MAWNFLFQLKYIPKGWIFLLYLDCNLSTQCNNMHILYLVQNIPVTLTINSAKFKACMLLSKLPLFFCDLFIFPSPSQKKEQKNLFETLKAHGHNLVPMCMCYYCLLLFYCLDIYHSVFGDLEESLQSCCYKALETAGEEKLSTVVFWLDGFASLQGNVHGYDIMAC